jgi:predicted CoA-binding protein
MPTVAVIGASGDRHKFGNKAVRALRDAGYAVIPINPNEKTVEGLETYASVLDVPGAIDLATLYVQPEIGERVIEEIAQKGISEVWVNPGAESPRLLARARALKLKAIEQCSIIAVGERPGKY